MNKMNKQRRDRLTHKEQVNAVEGVWGLGGGVERLSKKKRERKISGTQTAVW